MVVVLKIELHCEDCSEEMKKRILKIKGIDVLRMLIHIAKSQNLLAYVFLDLVIAVLIYTVWLQTVDQEWRRPCRTSNHHS